MYYAHFVFFGLVVRILTQPSSFFFPYSVENTVHCPSIGNISKGIDFSSISDTHSCVNTYLLQSTSRLINFPV